MMAQNPRGMATRGYGKEDWSIQAGSDRVHDILSPNLDI